ncbi:MAG: M48 family metalloprotease [Desulfobulbaceae bacterium]|nr:M48 family metalloprotease [Desulfobulbaceae bacterium]HIJ79971.1 M48 family metalloprotease [Deltaproteobacteria bacterium]
MLRHYLAIFFLLWALVVVAGCAVNPATGKSELAFYQMGEAEELKLGEKSFPEAVQQMHGDYDDPQLASYLNKVGLRLAKVSHRPQLPYEFKLVNDSSPNAFALPGGKIAITRGLLVALENEAQLAAVLAHEIAHVTARHASQNMQRGILLGIGLQVLAHETSGGSYGALARQAGELAGAVLNSTYSQEQEREADRLGIDYMVKAFYNPQGAVELQRYFYEKSGKQEPKWLEGLFRTHPFSKERMRINQDYVQSRYGRILMNPAYGSGAEDFAAATASLKKSRKAYDDYDQARKKEQAKDLAGAIVLYRQAVQAAPGQALLNTGLGMALLKNKKYDEAQQYLAEAIRLSPGYFESQFGMGYVYLVNGSMGQATTHLEKSMELMPTLGGAFYLAEAYEKNSKPDKAYPLYLQVAKADPQGSLGRAAAGRAGKISREFGVR